MMEPQLLVDIVAAKHKNYIHQATLQLGEAIQQSSSQRVMSRNALCCVHVGYWIIRGSISLALDIFLLSGKTKGSWALEDFLE